jgi:hypothetical protein
MNERESDTDVAALLDKAIGMLEDELEDHPDPLLVMVPHEQKAEFLANFRRFRRQLAEGNIPPLDQRGAGMASEVIESWPFSYLGEVIVRAQRAWRDYTPPRSEKNPSQEGSAVSETVARDRRKRNR